MTSKQYAEFKRKYRQMNCTRKHAREKYAIDEIIRNYKRGKTK